ncbi:ClpP family protease [Fodinicola acaciae]|uniref:ClpP family protease n=1 Tax=Fodinicola acaciae TaxID=2681555 RepID=UPI0013D014FB|nr:ATP-dependent Clp protease proteolytic subunit [Fodinicola acaciae]
MPGRFLPSITESDGFGQRTIDPYSRLFKDRIVVVGGSLDDTAGNDVAVQLLHLDSDNPEHELAIYLNCPDGTVSAALAIYDTIQSLTCEVATVCLGEVGPTAALVLASGTPGKRKMLPSARAILREPAMEVNQGSAADLIRRADDLLRLRARLEDLFAQHTGRTVSTVHDDLSRQLTLDADGAVAYGIADLVLRTGA